ncbi:MAG: DUF6167 family protein [Mycobacteriales bacterium]|nr:DUF6167 family protein [Frankia sp.]
MRRVFWTGLGIGLGGAAGVLVARKLRRAQEALTPSSLAGALIGSITGLGDAVRGFASEVRAGMAEREDDLRTQLGLDGEPGE